MKRIAALFLSLLMLFSLLTVGSYAAEQDVSTTERITYNDDGSYDIITLTIIENASARATTSKTATKTHSHYVSSTLVWTYSVTGTFSYTGATATATSCSDSYKIYDSSWSNVSHSVSKSGATVTGTAKFKKGILPVSPTVKITCSATGTIS